MNGVIYTVGLLFLVATIVTGYTLPVASSVEAVSPFLSGVACTCFITSQWRSK